jgi:DNA-binding NarL/FixJ family response regulator
MGDVMIRIFVCTDDSLTCAGLGALFAAQPDFEVVGVATGETASGVAATAPDVVVVSCAEIDVALHAHVSTIAKVVTFADFSNRTPADVLALGARAVLAVGAGPAELMQAIRVVASGDTVLMPLAVHQYLDTVMRTVDLCQVGAAATRLTSREADVLQLLAGGLSNAEVATALFVSGATVRTHVHHILRKMAVRSRAQAVAVAYRAGLVAAERAPGATV